MIIKYKLNGYEGEAVFYENEITASIQYKNIYGRLITYSEKQKAKHIASIQKEREEKLKKFFKMVKVLKKKKQLFDYQIIN